MVRETEISTQFGFIIYDLIPMKGVYYLKTNKGGKCLKKLNYGIQKMTYIYMAKEHIIKNGFERIDKNNLTIEGTPYAFVNDDLYAVTEWIDGRECDFRDEDDLKAASETLANFHLCARNFVPEDLIGRNDIGKLNFTLQKRLSTLNKMRDMARKKKRKSEFDILYLSNVDYYIELSQEALNILDVDKYNRVCAKSEEEHVLCHHDFTYHNILLDKEGNSHIIDFDYLKSEVQIYDMATLMVKALKRLNWDKQQGSIILNSYRSINDIDKDEENVLKCLLTFPQRFWRLANRYYYKEAGWSEDSFTKKLREIIDEKEKYKKFIENIDSIL
ncbi:MAG TPA: CotS family spore coat protein [Clostridiaceae bacterium]|jgi:CotS family spore coat protein|nr:CotS family spore coat protein [Clostridiaceae bacterium]HBF77531.1 CotS family spore coat protein [Clostridiaceae bacterium]HBG38249.1 CotS family spore coat protein [Clostridiaceae bacterium]HBX47950.1 CotS family spore coat protein [Clostridiaceae bacterium]